MKTSGVTKCTKLLPGGREISQTKQVTCTMTSPEAASMRAVDSLAAASKAPESTVSLSLTARLALAHAVLPASDHAFALLS